MSSLSDSGALSRILRALCWVLAFLLFDTLLSIILLRAFRFSILALILLRAFRFSILALLIISQVSGGQLTVLVSLFYVSSPKQD